VKEHNKRAKRPEDSPPAAPKGSTTTPGGSRTIADSDGTTVTAYRTTVLDKVGASSVNVRVGRCSFAELRAARRADASQAVKRPPATAQELAERKNNRQRLSYDPVNRHENYEAKYDPATRHANYDPAIRLANYDPKARSVKYIEDKSKKSLDQQQAVNDNRRRDTEKQTNEGRQAAWRQNHAAAAQDNSRHATSRVSFPSSISEGSAVGAEHAHLHDEL
jgi:hypothetical protein